MKKVVSLVLALVLVMSLTTMVAFADSTLNATTPSGTVTATYTKDGSYTVTIPADFTVSTTASKQNVSAASVVIASGKKLKVTMTANFLLADKDNNNNTLAYTAGKTDAGTGISSGDAVLEVAAGTATGNQDIYFKVTSDATISGTYTDVITFEVSVVSA